MNFGNGLEEVVCLVNGHGQDVGDALASVPHFQGFSVETLALARFAFDVHVWKEVHLHRSDACALAIFAPPTRHVERESPLLVATNLGLRQQRELGANQVHQPRVGRRVGPRCTTDGALIDGNALVDVL